MILDEDLRVVSCNASFFATFKTGVKPTASRLIYKIGNGQWDVPELRTLLEEVLPTNEQFEDFRIEADFPKIGTQYLAKLT